nr:sodium/myo-inositol cotransporter isoform X1 [Ciona intestinalis]|eukprot:XP_018669842.1 sodium/myo-inositol cotransporter isoform X1 [Ciona intestinalis]
MPSKQYLDAADLAVVAAYFVAIVVVGVVASCRSKRDTIQGYFLAGRSMNWFMVGASLFVSNIGSEHFIGLAGSGASGGIGVGAWLLNGPIVIQLLGWIFVPVYIASGICTMPEYLERRFGGKRLRIYLAVLTLILYCLTKISVNLYAGSLFLQQCMGWGLYSSVTILLAVTGVLTVTGGLTMVMYTDSLQAVIMVLGAAYLTIQGFMQVGGYYSMKEQYLQATPNLTYVQQVYNVTMNVTDSCFPKPNPQSFKMFKGINDPKLPLFGFIFGQTPSTLWYWCTDQVIVQRALAARSLSHAQGGTTLAGIIKVLPLYIMVMPGMISRVLYPNDVACVPGKHCLDVCGSEVGCSNIAYPRLVLGIMPSGARGLMMAVMIAALMSDLDSIFNSSSTIFTLDLWKRLRKSASNTELMIVGRLFIVVLVGVSIAWVPIVLQFQAGELFFYILEVSNYISPPIAAIFLTAIFWPRCTEKGAFYGGLIGSALGIARLVAIFLFKPPKCGEADTRPAFLTSLHYMYYAAIIFTVTAIVAVIVSLFAEQPDPDSISRLTYWSRNDPAPIAEEIELKPITEDCQQTQFDVDDPNFDVNDPTDIASSKNETNLCLVFLRACARFICGIKDSAQVAENAVVFPSIKQNRREKLFLRVCLVVSLSVPLSLYIIWSV